MTYADPVEAMREMPPSSLLRRSGVAKRRFLPNQRTDWYSRGPDIFVTGHVHGHECLDFRGTTLVCSSTWQDQTLLPANAGFQPKPCMLTIINLKSHKSISIPFA